MPNPAAAPKNHLPGLAIPFLLCGYVLLAGYVDLFPGYGLYNEKRIIQVVLLGTISIASLIFFHRDLAGTFNQLPSLSKRLLLAFLLLGTISTALHSTYYKQSLLELGLFGLLFISVLSVATAYHTLQHHFHRIILGFLLLAAGLHIVMVASGYIASLIEPVSLLPSELFANFSNRRFFNQLQSWTLPLIVLPVILFRHKKNYYRHIYASIAIGWWLLLFVSGGRGTLLGISTAIILAHVIYKSRARLWIRWQLIAATNAFLLYLFLFYVVAAPETMRAFSVLRDTGLSGRDALWQASWKLLQSDFLLGIGPMNFACKAEPQLLAHPHNALVQIAVEWGLLAAVIVFFLFVWGAWCWIKRSKAALKHANDTSDHLIPIALFAALITAAVHALFSGVIIMPHSQIMLVLILGWMLGIYFPSPKQPARPTLTIAILALLTATSIALLLTGMYPAMTSLNLDETTARLAPRFWQQGRFCY